MHTEFEMQRECHRGERHGGCSMVLSRGICCGLYLSGTMASPGRRVFCIQLALKFA